MRVVDTVDAYRVLCPFQPGGFLACRGKECMAWRVVNNRIEREDHSGAKVLMYAQAANRHQIVKRTGPPGSLGILILEEQGVCARLYPSIHKNVENGI